MFTVAMVSQNVSGCPEPKHVEPLFPVWFSLFPLTDSTGFPQELHLTNRFLVSEVDCARGKSRMMFWPGRGAGCFCRLPLHTSDFWELRCGFATPVLAQVRTACLHERHFRHSTSEARSFMSTAYRTPLRPKLSSPRSASWVGATAGRMDTRVSWQLARWVLSQLREFERVDARALSSSPRGRMYPR